jgi:ketosteroid isomerase-like protein
MADDAEFLRWFETTWREAEVALHDGTAGARDGTWSTREPVTLFGAWLEASNSTEAQAVFRRLEESFSGVIGVEVSLVAHGVSGDLAYTVHREHSQTSVNGEPRDYVLRVTQVYRCEDGTWKVAHRHADYEPTESGS